MLHLIGHRQDAKSSRTRAARPVMEELEGRLLMYATTGDKFAFGSRITWSIVPDGTNLGGVSSNLQSSLNSDVGASNWLQAFQDAFAEWETYANVNFSQVGDNGAPTGSGNYQQGSPNFGDIRIGGYAQASNILAYTLLPPAANGGSDSGDIFLNSSIDWNIGSNYDLETVAFHEIGHALGLGHSADPNAAMYAYYGGVQQAPDADDVAGIQAIWGPRAEDGLAAGNSNFTSAKAADITKFINGANNQIVLPNQDVASSAESYWFKVTTPANASSNFTVQIQAASLSELSPKVQIYNASLQGLVQVAAASNSYRSTISASISNATPNTTYYIRVLGSNGGANGAGAYAMTVNMGPTTWRALRDQPGRPPEHDGPRPARPGRAGVSMRKLAAPTRPRILEVDIPDPIPVGKTTAVGDYLVIQTKKTHKHIKTHIKVPHPINRGFVHPKKAKSHH